MSPEEYKKHLLAIREANKIKAIAQRENREAKTSASQNAKEEVKNNSAILKTNIEQQKEKTVHELFYNKHHVPQSPNFMVKLCKIDQLTGKRSSSIIEVSMDEFKRALKSRSIYYTYVVNGCLKDNLDFDRMCVGINANVFIYLSETSQKDPYIIQFINGIRMKDRIPINFLFRVGAYPKYGKLFKEYLDCYNEEANALREKYGQEVLGMIEEVSENIEEDNKMSKNKASRETNRLRSKTEKDGKNLNIRAENTKQKCVQKVLQTKQSPIEAQIQNVEQKEQTHVQQKKTRLTPEEKRIRSEIEWAAHVEAQRQRDRQMEEKKKLNAAMSTDNASSNNLERGE